jgi:hypothetical protein
MELVREPERYRASDTVEAARREGEVGFEQALELQQRLFIKSDVRQLFAADSGFLQAVLDGASRKAIVVFLPGEALFLRRSDDPAVADERRGRVVIERRDSEDRMPGRYGDLPVPK